MQKATFTEDDKKQIKAYGLSTKEVEKQIETFKKGIPYVTLVSAANVDDGIQDFEEEEIELFTRKYENTKADVVKFIPASGAASRMFKALHQFLEEYHPDDTSLEAYLEEKISKVLNRFFDEIENFAFFDTVVEKAIEKDSNYKKHNQDKQYYFFVQTMIAEDGLNMSELPKGLIPFHKYENYTATAFEEHLIEAAAYAEREGVAKLHFTVTEEHLDKFKEEHQKIKERVEKQTQTKFEITYSFQKKSTDTVAVDAENRPFRDDEDHILFRPGGHGALIQNLNDIDTDVIFIKNIDNVIKQEHLEIVASYKKALAGELINVQERVYEILKQLDKEGFSKDLLHAANQLLKEKLSVKTTLETEEDIRNFLNRPIRVCGMVANKGEPGGGPFWVKDGHNDISLQIIEGAQMNTENPEQNKIAENATHFNPVDIICAVRDYKGNKFDLTEFVDDSKCFIAKKSKFGRNLKALELPGLWNGGMAYWNTLFVEVPIITFNPVKNIADLLKENHVV